MTVYSLFLAGSRPIAALRRGEYIAVSVSPGMTAFSWVSAPARGQTVMMDVGRGQQIFLRVQPSGITPIANDTARMSFQDLQTVDRTRVFDTARVVDEVVTPIQAVAESPDNPARPSEPPKPANKRPLADAEPPQTVRQAASQQKPIPNGQEIKIRGYVTAVTSPSTFEIDLYRVIRNGNVKMQFENPGRDVQFNIDNVKVGTELDIQGEYNETTRELLANTIKVDLDQFRSTPNPQQLALVSRPVVDEPPARPQPSDPPKPATRKALADTQPQQAGRQPPNQQEPREQAKTLSIRVQGYVTAVTSPTTFEIEDYRVTRDEAVTLQFENEAADVQFQIENVQVGTELDIKGDFNDKTRELRAKTIKVNLEQFRKLKNTVVLAQPPSGGLVRSENGWAGTFDADGQRIRLSPESKVSFKLTSEPTERKTPGSEKTDSETDTLASLQDIKAGMLMTYTGVRDASGMILADSVEFARNDFEKGEQDLWNRSMVRFKSPDSSTTSGERSDLGELTVPDIGKFKLVPNEEVQEYVSKVGKSLIPKYALSIAQTDALRFRFQFYVVVNNEPNAFALPTGVFVIYSGLFAVLENEAQLAAVIGHEMAHVLQEHQWRDIKERKILTTASGVTVGEAFGRRTLRDTESLTAAAMRNGYTPEQENQADRIGLEYMVNAGYDPREAPKLWTAIARATGFKGKNSFYNTYDNHATRRSYLLNQIKGNYSNLDFADLRIEENSFRRMTTLANEAVTGKVQAVLQGER